MPKDTEKWTLSYGAIFIIKQMIGTSQGGKEKWDSNSNRLKNFLQPHVTASIVATAIVPAASASSVTDYTDVSDRYKECCQIFGGQRDF